MKVFSDNLEVIKRHNFKNHSYTLSVNKFADWTHQEYKSRLLSSPIKTESSFSKKISEKNQINDAWSISLDWRSTNNPSYTNVISPVKNQLSCGSCYAFAAAETTETAWAIHGNKLPSLSPQQIVDCSTIDPYDNAGCNGGNPNSTFQYIIDNGLCSDKDYPYTAQQGNCNKCKAIASLKSFENVPDETTMLEKMRIGVLSIAIEADTQVFQFYSSGVFDDDSCGTNLDHAVVLVGYGTDNNNKDYWILRNSWGQSWGESGYMRIVRNKNMCGLSQYVISAQ
jgi:C1A family cysteine protease